MEEIVGLSDLALWTVLLGFFGPIVIAVAAKPAMKPLAKIGIQVGYSVIAGVGTAYFTGAFTGREIVSAVLLVFASSVISYKGLWKPTNAAETVERSINGGDDTTVDSAVNEADELPEPEPVSPQEALPDDDWR